MNCKPGDLAIVVRSWVGNEGKIVRCISRYDGPWRNKSGSLVDYKPGWRVEGNLVDRSGRPKPMQAIVDSVLRPIRDSDGEDEMLRIAGLPQKETA